MKLKNFCDSVYCNIAFLLWSGTERAVVSELCLNFISVESHNVWSSMSDFIYLNNLFVVHVASVNTSVLMIE